ncbi:MAG: hypothetical protein JNJ59_12875 [Deltaproteobacteria bacterium]|nr:hypothetical protein [Deltaproteobacteria bacterium]
MDAVYLTLFVSTVLAVLGAVLFTWTHAQKTRDHDLRLSLLPLDDDESTVSPLSLASSKASPSPKSESARGPR